MRPYLDLEVTMKTLPLLLVLLSSAALAGSAAPPPANDATPAPTGGLAPTDPNAPWIEAVSPGLWKVTVTCSLGAETRPGSVQIHAETQPDIYALPHTGLARARACLSLSQALRERKDWQPTAMAAREGIEALGPDYATPGGGDETRVGLQKAEDALRQGSPMAGADQMIGVLSARIALYEKRYAGELQGG